MAERSNNYMKKLIAFVLISVIALLIHVPVSAFDKEAGSTGLLVNDVPVIDPRIDHLKKYLSVHNPELANDADQFINEADRLSLDWKLVAAIAGTESTFCRFLPANSYNCWGWGIPTGASDGIHFKSFRDGITQVSEGIRKRYLNRDLLSVEEIGSVYAASPAWSSHVRYFMDKIENFDESKVELPLAMNL
jgi:hypothetical protein